MIVAGLATIKGREAHLHQTVKSISSQVDMLFITFNGYNKDQVPEEYRKDRKISFEVNRGNTLGDGAKFRILDMMPHSVDYFFSIDDDLIYPRWFVKRTVDALNSTKHPVITSYHGSIFLGSFPRQSYYKQRISFPVLDSVNRVTPVHCPGTGCMAFKPSQFFFNTSCIKMANMADIWVGIEAQRQETPVLVLPHRAGDFGYAQGLPIEQTIWGQNYHTDTEQTAAINLQAEQGGWDARPAPLDFHFA